MWIATFAEIKWNESIEGKDSFYKYAEYPWTRYKNLVYLKWALLYNSKSHWSDYQQQKKIYQFILLSMIYHLNHIMKNSNSQKVALPIWAWQFNNMAYPHSIAKQRCGKEAGAFACKAPKTLAFKCLLLAYDAWKHKTEKLPLSKHLSSLLSAFEIQVLSTSAKICRGNFRIFQFASAIRWQKRIAEDSAEIFVY